jgi:O-antigen/teichoic acid export membrane protein
MRRFIVLIRAAAENLTRGSASGMHWAVAGQGIVSATNLAITLAITWGFGLETFGRYAICFLIVMLFRNLMDGVILQPLASIGPKVGPKSLEIYRGFLLASFVTYAIGATLIFLAGVAGASAFIELHWLSAYMLPVALYMVAYLCAEFMRNYLLIFGWRKRVVVLDACRAVLQVGGLGLLVWTGAGEGALGFILCILSFGLFAAATPFVPSFGGVAWRMTKWRAFYLRHGRFLRWATPAVFFRYSQTNVPFFWAASVLGEEVVGAARAIQSVANLINVPLNGLQLVLPAIASRTLDSGGFGQMKSFILRVVLTIFSFNVILALVLIYLSDSIVRLLFGGEVVQFSFMLWIYCLINAINILDLGAAAVFQVVEKPKVLFGRFLASTLFAVVLSFVAMEAMGPASLPLIQLSTLTLGVLLLLWRFRSVDVSQKYRDC